MKNNKFGDIFNKLLKEVGDPVEFQLPDWFKKQKPLSYTFIRRNIYLTKKIRKRVEDDGIFCACYPSTGSSVCGRDCLCGMLLSSCSPSCRCGSSCLNKPFHQRAMKKMKLVKTEKCGSGLVADEDIKKGEFVIEYVGEVIDDKTCEERLWEMKRRGETNFYLCEINRDMVIDATYKGNKSRYINHSCWPNTEMQKWRIDGETRIGIFATRDISKGEHLTYDYQFVQFGADQDCHCGALGCRRKLGAKPSKPNNSSDAALDFVVCEMATSSPKMKAILAEHSVRDYQNGGLLSGTQGHSTYGPDESKLCSHNCIGEIIYIRRPMCKRFSQFVVCQLSVLLRITTDGEDILSMDNLRRRYLRCNKEDERRKCKFFDWIDPPLAQIQEMEQLKYQNAKLIERNEELGRLEHQIDRGKQEYGFKVWISKESCCFYCYVGRTVLLFEIDEEH